MTIYNTSISSLNTFVGNVLQQATSVVTDTNQVCYELVDGCYSVYGFEASCSLDKKISIILIRKFSISQVNIHSMLRPSLNLA